MVPGFPGAGGEGMGRETAVDKSGDIHSVRAAALKGLKAEGAAGTLPRLEGDAEPRLEGDAEQGVGRVADQRRVGG